MEGKLAAVRCADVAGYSRLMGDDEEATLYTCSAYPNIFDRLYRESPWLLYQLGWRQHPG